MGPRTGFRVLFALVLHVRVLTDGGGIHIRVLVTSVAVGHLPLVCIG